MACYKGFYYVCAGMIYKLQGFSIKIFFDFEIEIDFDRGTIAINQCFFFLFCAADLPEPGAGDIRAGAGAG